MEGYRSSINEAVASFNIFEQENYQVSGSRINPFSQGAGESQRPYNVGAISAETEASERKRIKIQQERHLRAVSAKYDTALCFLDEKENSLIQSLQSAIEELRGRVYEQKVRCLDRQEEFMRQLDECLENRFTIPQLFFRDEFELRFIEAKVSFADTVRSYFRITGFDDPSQPLNLSFQPPLVGGNQWHNGAQVGEELPQINSVFNQALSARKQGEDCRTALRYSESISKFQQSIRLFNECRDYRNSFLDRICLANVYLQSKSYYSAIVQLEIASQYTNLMDYDRLLVDKGLTDVYLAQAEASYCRCFDVASCSPMLAFELHSSFSRKFSFCESKFAELYEAMNRVLDKPAGVALQQYYQCYRSGA